MLQLTDEALTSTQCQDYRSHPLATTDAVTVKMEYDADTESFVTYVKELHGVSTFGDTELEALEMTAEMIHGYIASMEERGMKIPLAASKLAELKRRLEIPALTDGVITPGVSQGTLCSN
jgi:predicted RNase H-like HicB family nuclease